MNKFGQGKTELQRSFKAFVLIFLLGNGSAFAQARAVPASPPQLLIILDGSSSMDDQLAGALKYKLAGQALNKALAPYSGKLKAGLIAYGSKDPTSCKDLRQLIPLKTLKSTAFSQAINKVKPVGKSPIGAAIALAAIKAKIKTNPINMLLIADGGDNCRADICSTAKIIANHSPQTKIHVIGLGTTSSIQKLACLSTTTNGLFKPVANKGQMQTALNSILRTALNPGEGETKTPASGAMAFLKQPPLPGRRPPYKIAKLQKSITKATAPAPVPQPEPALPLVENVPPKLQLPTPGEMVQEDVKQVAPKIPDTLKLAQNTAPKPEPVAPVSAPKKTPPTTTPSEAQAEQAPVAALPETIPANTFIGAKPSIEVTLPVTTAPIKLRALISEEGAEIETGLIWRIYETKKDDAGRYKLVKSLKAPRFEETLPLGVYLVNLSWGRSHLTEKLDILSSKPFAHNFVLNAGGLRLGARHSDGSQLPARQIAYKIYSDERDQFGKRRLILNNANPGKTIRLNAGIYHVTSLYGTANALIGTDITIEAGKLTEAIINHTASKVTFKLVNQPGGEALAGTVWQIMSPDGKLIKKAGGALPTHILAAGDYNIQAQYSGRTYARKITIEPGEPVHVEIVIQ